ncbi:MAG: GDSL-type esterase/lipase family protein, partial [Lachnospiraceae bacterium]|nr:GDSL-type esterase/lipase family protein [Lachnospiraceae bacterium]
MKYVLCYGDSNTHGYNPENGFRYPENVRWTGRLANLMGDNYKVIEEGLNSRTTALEPEGEPWRSGAACLEACIRTHMPVDLVILMLGSNDMKKVFKQNE